MNEYVKDLKYMYYMSLDMSAKNNLSSSFIIVSNYCYDIKIIIIFFYNYLLPYWIHLSIWIYEFLFSACFLYQQ